MSIIYNIIKWLNPIIVDEPLGLRPEQQFSAMKRLKESSFAGCFH